jgi:hypothetical protein
MKIIKRILAVIAILILVAAIAGMFMPSEFKMERSLAINADQKVIFDQVNTLKNWEQWSPWMKMDPEMNITYSGPASGVGASYDWVSTNNNLGTGTLTITESVPYDHINTEMDIKENGKATAGFRISKSGERNLLSWWFEADMGNNPFKKLMAGLMGKGFMSKTFDQGLNDIKQQAEKNREAPVSSVLSTDSTATDSLSK